MPTLDVSNDTVSHAGRIAHDVGLAGMVGGQLFGRLALHPAVTEISDRRERGAVVNAAWRRYGLVNGLGLVTVAAGWITARNGEAATRRLAGRERTLARAKDALVALTFATGAATAVEGMRFARQAPGGAVPLTDGDHAAPEASPSAARLKRRLNALGIAAITSELALLAVHASLDQAAFRQAPLRRRVLRRS